MSNAMNFLCEFKRCGCGVFRDGTRVTLLAL
jgi:hypothetical protein